MLLNAKLTAATTNLRITPTGDRRIASSSMSEVIAALSDSLNDAATDDEVVTATPPVTAVVASSSDDASLPSFFQDLAQSTDPTSVQLLEAEPTTAPVSLEVTQRTQTATPSRTVKRPHWIAPWLIGGATVACLWIGWAIAFRGGREFSTTELSKVGDLQGTSNGDSKSSDKKLRSVSFAKLPPLPKGPLLESLEGLLSEPSRHHARWHSQFVEAGWHRRPHARHRNRLAADDSIRIRRTSRFACVAVRVR